MTRIKPPLPLPPAEEIDIQALYNAWMEGTLDMIVVMGPTASGKTRYAVKLARELNALHGAAVAEIISADSRQVYRGMDIGTGKDLGEYGEIPVHLVDIAPAGSKYNIYQYQKDFSRVYSAMKERSALPILCGGSGLYVEAVCAAYELGEASQKLVFPHNCYYICTLVERDERNRRIDARLDERLEEGMVDEIKALLDSGIAAEDLIYYGLEYRFVTLYILEEYTYEYMREHLAIAIHQFAKRQMTWLRGMARRGFTLHWVGV